MSENLDLQLKFLNDLERALNEAMEKGRGGATTKLDELAMMKKEVDRAQLVIKNERQKSVKKTTRRKLPLYETASLREAALG